MCDHCMNRRQFHAITSAGLAGSLMGLSWAAADETAAVEPWNPDLAPVATGRPLRVQPVLAHANQSPREKSSWRSWSEIVNEPAAAEEMQRIAGELQHVVPTGRFSPRDIPPHQSDHD